MSNTAALLKEESFTNDLSNDELYRLYTAEQDSSILKLLYKKNKTELDILTEEMLVALYQNGYKDVKPILFEKIKRKDYNSLDEAVVLMAQNGDEKAKHTISIKYLKFIEDTVTQIKRQGRYNRGDELEDLIQYGYIGFLKAIRDFKIELKRPFKYFARKVIIRHIHSIINRSSTNKLKTLNNAYSYHTPVNKSDSDNTFEQMLKTDEYQPEHYLFVVETFNEIWNTLSTTEKMVCWYYAEDYKYEEIGKLVFSETHKTTKEQVKAVDNTLQRIKLKRERYLEQLKKKDS